LDKTIPAAQDVLDLLNLLIKSNIKEPVIFDVVYDDEEVNNEKELNNGLGSK
jgi:hypothetical protein